MSTGNMGLLHWDNYSDNLLYVDSEFAIANFRDRSRIYPSMQSSGKLQLSATEVYDFTADDLQDLGEIGRGAFGAVNKMTHRR